MPNLTASAKVPVSDLLSKVLDYRYNPTLVQRAGLDHLSQIVNGEIDIVDPTNPFIYLLENSAINTAAVFTGLDANLRKQYPVLAQTEDDLYLHMSDKDFLNRFAQPTSTQFTFIIKYDELLNAMVYDPVELCHKAVVLRDSEFTVNGVTFSLQYPVVIRKFDNDVLEVSYDATITSPLMTLPTNVIKYVLSKASDTTTYLMFAVDVTQYDVISTNLAVTASNYIQSSISYTDSFYYCRVWTKSSSTGNVWQEIKTTHTDQVYDPLTATAVLKVNEQNKTCQVFIPPIYVKTGLIDGAVRVDLYQTKGQLTMDMSNFALSEFTTKLMTLDEARDINDYTNAMNNVSFTVSSALTVTGGSDALSFNDLRNQVINNAVGEVVIPITPDELESYVEKLGFGIVKNVDVITNRIYMATRSLPAPTNSKLVTPANLTINTIIATLGQLGQLDTARDHLNNRITLLPETLYQNVNSVISPLTTNQVAALKILDGNSLVETVNINSYLFSPFYYVLDNSGNEFQSRAYHLASPSYQNKNFISENVTAGVQVNTSTYTISKVASGYQIFVTVTSDSTYKSLDDKYVGAQLSFVPVGEVARAYINGVLVGKDNSSGERVFRFDLKTDYDVDGDDNLILTNFQMFANETALTATPLTNSFTLTYLTSSIPVNFVPDAANVLQGTFLLTNENAVITREEHTVTLGSALANLWTRTRSVLATDGYQTYSQDVPMIYTEDVYAVNPTTGSVFSVVNGQLSYTLQHNKGDTVLGADGNPIYLHRAGDIKLDTNGNPIPIDQNYVTRHIDILFIDGAYYFATDTAYLSYDKEVADVVNTWITSELADIQKVLLEKTKIFYYPKKSLGLISVMVNSENVKTINSEQSFNLILYVTGSVFNDSVVRNKLTTTAISIINSSLENTTVSITDISASLRDAFGSLVAGFNLSGLGGSTNNYDTLTVLTESGRLSLSKGLTLQQDGTLIVSENVAVSFVKYDKTLIATDTATAAILS